MCRLLLQINSNKNKQINSIIRTHAIELEKAMGGDGNGLYIPEKNKIYKSFNIKKIIDHMKGEPFLFHTRYATGNNISIPNCHPFAYKNIILAHNGFAVKYLNPISNADTKNLLIAYQDNQLNLKDMEWSGNIIIYDKDTQLIFIYIKNYLKKITFIDGTIIITSQITDILEDNKHKIRKSEDLENGIYQTMFDDNNITKIDSLRNQYDYERSYIPPPDEELEDDELLKEIDGFKFSKDYPWDLNY